MGCQKLIITFSFRRCGNDHICFCAKCALSKAGTPVRYVVQDEQVLSTCIIDEDLFCSMQGCKSTKSCIRCSLSSLLSGFRTFPRVSMNLVMSTNQPEICALRFIGAIWD